MHKKDETPLIKCLHMSDAENEMSLLHEKLHNNSNMWPEKKRTRKWFSEKPIVAFANGTVFVLDVYIYRLLLSLFGLMFWP